MPMRKSLIGPGEALDAILAAWEQDQRKLEWCRCKRADIQAELTLISIAEWAWFCLDPVSQLEIDDDRRKTLAGQEKVLESLRVVDLETWSAYATAYFDDVPLPGQSMAQVARATSSQEIWQDSERRDSWLQSRSRGRVDNERR
jgi:hypothetical protein